VLPAGNIPKPGEALRGSNKVDCSFCRYCVTKIWSLVGTM
jgi:hypothetical protein